MILKSSFLLAERILREAGELERTSLWHDHFATDWRIARSPSLFYSLLPLFVCRNERVRPMRGGLPPQLLPPHIEGDPHHLPSIPKQMIPPLAPRYFRSMTGQVVTSVIHWNRRTGLNALFFSLFFIKDKLNFKDFKQISEYAISYPILGGGR